MQICNGQWDRSIHRKMSKCIFKWNFRLDLKATVVELIIFTQRAFFDIFSLWRGGGGVGGVGGGGAVEGGGGKGGEVEEERDEEKKEEEGVEEKE